ncbi:hypothetical protein GCM10010266_43520 [Streptomyces griseomycini]|nr:hypothetical protein GCM10010266_43520 [Streptomyces griseomycini]GGR28944.1 hypothetical protein GCM10015536_38290 [Streptomyces griseomycini]
MVVGAPERGAVRPDSAGLTGAAPHSDAGDTGLAGPAPEEHAVRVEAMEVRGWNGRPVTRAPLGAECARVRRSPVRRSTGRTCTRRCSP